MDTNENEFKLGDMVQHKATGKNCVVIGLGKNIIIVRDSDNSIQIYCDCELEPVKTRTSGNVF